MMTTRPSTVGAALAAAPHGNPRGQSADAAEESRYRAGTLTYTKKGLVVLFVWMLWGDFCFRLMELVIPSLLPISLKNLGASNALIGLLVGSVPGALNMLVNPVVSTASDRHRGRWGRRIPFLVWPTPFVTLFLILIGYGENLGAWLHGVALGALGLSPTTTILLIISLLAVAFQFFNMFICSVYYYLFADVVPQAFLGRFMALFGMVGTAAAFVFNRFVLGLAETHMKEIYVATGLLYAAAFGLMCWRVREGQYPRLEPAQRRKPIRRFILDYARECFTVRFYIFFFLSSSITRVASVCTGMFTLLFYMKTLGLNLGTIGKINSWITLASLILLLPMGWLSDRVHPMRLQLVSLLFLPIHGLLCFFFIGGPVSVLWFGLLGTFANAALGASTMPLTIALLPKDRLGQFCSAQAIFIALFVIVFNVLGGLFIDWIGDYRWMYLWFTGFTLVAFVFKVLVYRGWRRRGGPHHYLAPG